MPSRLYSGQKFNKLVARNTMATTKATMAKVPVTLPVKYKIANTTAMRMRMLRSIEPMFFFITVEFFVNK